MLESLSPTLILTLLFILGILIFLLLSKPLHKNTLIYICISGFLLVFFLPQWLPPDRLIATTPKAPPVQTAEQIDFNAWYADYAKQMNLLDAIWQKYHRLIRLIRNDDISILNASIRMDSLYEESLSLQNTIEALSVPQQISLQNQAQVTSVIKKTQDYSNAHHAVIFKSKEILDSKNSRGKAREELIRQLQELIILETPPQLDILSHIAKIKDNIAAPKEDPLERSGEEK